MTNAISSSFDFCYSSFLFLPPEPMKRLSIFLGALLLLTACNNDADVALEEGIGVEKFQQAMPQGGKVVDPQHGEEQWFAYGAMAGVNEVPANGMTLAHFFDDRTFIHTIQLNITPAADGFFYEGWLVSPDGSEVVSTGHLTNHFGDTRHQLKYESERDLRAFAKVIVTLEPDDGDLSPAEHVVEGTLKVTER